MTGQVKVETPLNTAIVNRKVLWFGGGVLTKIEKWGKVINIEDLTTKATFEIADLILNKSVFY